MKQMSLNSNVFAVEPKRTGKREFLDQMNRVVPWEELKAIIEPHYPKDKTGRPPFGIATRLRIHFMQPWFGFSDPVMEEALHDVAMYRDFAGLDGGITRLPDKTTILRFRHLLETHHLAGPMLVSINELLCSRDLMLRAGMVVDATPIAAPSSTKNADGERDPEMHQTKKSNQWHFGMKAHIDAESGLVHTVIGTAANVNDVMQGNALLHADEVDASGDADCQGITKRDDAGTTNWHVAMRPGKRRASDRRRKSNVSVDAIERLKASIRAKVEHPFRVIKRQFGFAKVRYRGLAKNTVPLTTLFALSNLWMARHRSMPSAGSIRPWIQKRHRARSKSMNSLSMHVNHWIAHAQLLIASICFA